MTDHAATALLAELRAMKEGLAARVDCLETRPRITTLLLADVARVVNGKLDILGGGFSLLPRGAPSALAIKVQFPPHHANTSHTLTVTLLDEDGRLVSDDGGPIERAISFVLSPAPDAPQARPIDAALALAVGALPLRPGGTYVWRCSLDGEPHSAATATFTARAE